MRALFGGSFNPVHIGHLILARDVLEDFSLEEVIFVPAFVQPLKGELLLPPEVRLEALSEALSLEDRFKLWDYEIRKGGLSYTYQTLEKFWELYGEAPFFILGSDSFNTLPKWKEPLKVLELANLIVLSRPGFKVEVERVFKELGVSYPYRLFKRGRVELSEVPKLSVYLGRSLEVSSTEVRERLKSGRSISYLVPERVERVIRRWKDALQENV
jgi:nicotinate-nucleotide adenylyltransferase